MKANPLLLDLSHTSHTRARTGVQRVSRALYRNLRGKAVPVCFDPFEDRWRQLQGREEANLEANAPSSGRGAQWSTAARIRGWIRHLGNNAATKSFPTLGSPVGGAILPEIFSPTVGHSLSRLFAATTGPRVALFHDAIALRFPESAARSTVARFPSYLQELLRFDGIAAVSEESRDSLLDYWKWLGLAHIPKVAAIPLGVDVGFQGESAPEAHSEPTVLSVGSIEGRKNHLALLEACESLWAHGVAFRLRMVGLANKETGGPALAALDRLTAMGRPIFYDGAVDEARLESAYATCAFTVYPSLAEGFGLPVAESLAHGKACLCRMSGALGEIALGGGCVGLGDASGPEIAAAMGRLLAFPNELAALEAQARGRRFKTWDDYVLNLLDWMETLPGHA